MDHTISMFISYSWKDTKFVDGLDQALQEYAYKVERDIKDIEYAQSIKEFMKRIRKTDYSIIVLSDSFLKSENCMREIFEFIKDENFKDRIIPVVLESAKDIFDANLSISYAIYWKEKEIEFRERLNLIDDESKGGYLSTLNHISNIKASIGEILEAFRDMKMFQAEDGNLVPKIISYAGGGAKKEFQTQPKSRTQEYIKKWEDNLFLNNFTEPDNITTVNLSFKDLYSESLLPYYKFKHDHTVRKNLKDFLAGYANPVGKHMLLVFGNPGLGEYAFLSWFVTNIACHAESTLTYRFPSDLNGIDWDSIQDAPDITHKLLSELHLSYQELEGKTLILDGPDMVCGESGRIDLFHQLYWELIGTSSIDNFLLVIFHRRNSFSVKQKLDYDFITLQPWDQKQSEDFCSIYLQKAAHPFPKEAIMELVRFRDFCSTPLTLYMFLASNAPFSNETTLKDLYEELFSPEGERINQRLLEKSPNHMLASQNGKTFLYRILEQLAFWVYEHNSRGEFIPKEEYEKICAQLLSEYKEDVVPPNVIGDCLNSFKYLQGIGTKELYFANHSIYEYFASAYIFKSIHAAIDLSREQLAGVLGRLLKGNNLSTNMNCFLWCYITNSDIMDKFHKIDEAFHIMLQNGMTFYTAQCFKNAIQCEMYVFVNMLEIIHFPNRRYLRLDKSIRTYLGYTIRDTCYQHPEYTEGGLYLNLRDTDLRNVNLDGIPLKYINLTGANLGEANLRHADLRNVSLSQLDLENMDLSGLDLGYAYLSGVDLRDKDLENTNLTGACLTAEQASYLDKKYNLKGTKILPENSNVYISYEDYRKNNPRL